MMFLYGGFMYHQIYQSKYIVTFSDGSVEVISASSEDDARRICTGKYISKYVKEVKLATEQEALYAGSMPIL